MCACSHAMNDPPPPLAWYSRRRFADYSARDKKRWHKRIVVDYIIFDDTMYLRSHSQVWPDYAGVRNILSYTQSRAVMGKYQIKSHSKISNLLHWRFKYSSKISNLEWYRISHQNLESSNSKSQIKSQIPKQQKGFSKHISILLVPVNGNHWNFHFRSSAFTCIDLAVQSLPPDNNRERIIDGRHTSVMGKTKHLKIRSDWVVSNEKFSFNNDFEISVQIACLLNRIVKIWVESISNRICI